jgi:hypothetical protein
LAKLKVFTLSPTPPLLKSLPFLFGFWAEGLALQDKVSLPVTFVFFNNFKLLNHLPLFSLNREASRNALTMTLPLW